MKKQSKEYQKVVSQYKKAQDKLKKKKQIKMITTKELEEVFKEKKPTQLVQTKIKVHYKNSKESAWIHRSYYFQLS